MTAAEKERIEFAERLNKVLDDKGYPMRGRAQKVLAETKLNISDRAINKWLKGESIPDHSNLAILSRHYGVGFDWLATGNGSIDTHSKNFDLQAHIDSLPSAITHEQAVAEGQESIMVDVYDLSYCCGDGDKVEYEPLKKRLPFDPSFFTRRNIRPENFKLIFAKGDSMARYINEGDAIGVDISQTEIKDGEAYALFLDGDNMIKRLFIEGGGRLRLSSDNPAYKDKIIEPEFADSLKIVGRVVYRSG